MIVSWAEIATILGMGDSLTAQQHALINLLHPMAEAAVKSFLDYDPEEKTHVEFHPPNWGVSDSGDLMEGEVNVTSTRVSVGRRGHTNDVLLLKHLPVAIEGLEVREDPDGRGGQRPGSFGSGTILTPGTQYWLDVFENGLSRTGKLQRIGAWPSDPRSVKVTYKGGWSRQSLDAGEALPIKNAVLLTAQKAFKQAISNSGKRPGGALASESIGHYSYSLDSATTQLMTGMLVSVPPEAMLLLQPFKSMRLF